MFQSAGSMVSPWENCSKSDPRLTAFCFFGTTERISHRHEITVVGIGYVGLSWQFLLSQHNEVTAVDVAAERIELVNRGISPVCRPGNGRFFWAPKIEPDGYCGQCVRLSGGGLCHHINSHKL